MADHEIDSLVRMSCIACRKGEPTVTDAEIARFHPQIPDWQVVEVAGVRRLERVFNDVFGALRLTPFRSVRAVILGQDPYHRPGKAYGLAFSVPSGVAHPASLRTILRELETDLGRAVPADVSLERWARHGVLLLNVVLTVRRGCPGSASESATDARTSSASRASTIAAGWRSIAALST